MRFLERRHLATLIRNQHEEKNIEVRIYRKLIFIFFLSHCPCVDLSFSLSRPDIVIRDKKEKKMYIIDASCSSDAKVNEKITKYSGLLVELAKMWNSEYIVVPVVVGGLGAISHNYLKMIPTDQSIVMCLKITLLGSEKILRSVLLRK